jgi:iron-sulfur cluster assembly protein
MIEQTLPTLLTLTPAAMKKVQELFAGDPESKGKSLRIGLEPGGCSGFQYAFSFDEKKAGDTEIPCDGFKVLVDAQSANFLRNTTVDYLEDASSQGFKIHNPNVKKSCGCGQSNSF